MIFSRFPIVFMLFCVFSAHSAFAQRVVKLHVTSKIQSRFATTHVTSEIRNTADEDKEIFFEAQLPAEAFISNFTMKIKGEWQVGEVKEKAKAKQDYDRAKAGGHTAGLVEQKARETDRFRTSVNVAAGEKVKFDLTYQEILKRVHGVYKHVVNILSVEDVEDLKIDVSIVERGRIRNLHVPKFALKIGQKTNKELLGLAANSEAEIRQNVDEDGFATATVTYHPATKAAGQLAVLYDLERNFNGGDLEVVDGYFVHFFSPESGTQTSASTNVVFVLDKSGSMSGKKFQQLQEAMQAILADLKADDRFGMVWFSSNEKAWDCSMRVASSKNVQNAKKYVQDQNAGGSTNMQDALLEAFHIIKTDKEETNTSVPYMIVSLTDGMPDQSSSSIMKTIKDQNKDLKVRVHNLAFGNDADYKMLQKMSSENDGLARKIYEAADAKLQLEGFYSEIANPLFTNLDIEYLDGKANVSSIVRNRDDDTFYEGSEIMVVGKMADTSATTMRGQVSAAGSDGSVLRFRCGNECFGCCNFICPRWCLGWRRCPTPRPWKQRPQEPLLPPGTLRGFVERMWGYMTIKNLLKEAELESDSTAAKASKDEALRLSLHYNFVTKLTSMVVVDKEAALDPINEEEAPRSSAGRRLGSRGHSVGLAGPAGRGGSFSASNRVFGKISSSAMSGGFSSRRHSVGASRRIMPIPIGDLEGGRAHQSCRASARRETRSTKQECTLNLVVLFDGRANSAASREEALKLLRTLRAQSNNPNGYLGVAELTNDAMSNPKITLHYSSPGYDKLSSLSFVESSEDLSFQETMDLLSGTSGEQVFLIMIEDELLPQVVEISAVAAKSKGMRVVGYPMTEDNDESVENQMKVLAGDKDYVTGSIEELTEALKC